MSGTSVTIPSHEFLLLHTKIQTLSLTLSLFRAKELLCRVMGSYILLMMSFIFFTFDLLTF